MPVIFTLCFLSGFGTLAMEVLWTQMFSHVFQNTVYTFSALLVATLVCLALGAGIANLLSRRTWPQAKVLMVLVLAAGLSVALSLFLFMALTENMKIVTSSSGWGEYIFKVFKLTFTVVGVPLCLLGTIFPYLLKISERYVASAGETLGRLSAVNTAGAILGSLLAGFVLLGWLGLWHAIQVFAVLYLTVALLLPLPLRILGPV
jgi:spermidine synthase